MAPQPRFAFLDLAEKWTRVESSRVHLLPCPFDGTSTWGKGADRGPEALLGVSDQLEEYDIELDLEPYQAGIHCHPPVVFEGDDPRAAVDAIEAATQRALEETGVEDPLLIGLGGEHTVSVGLTRGLRRHRGPFSVLQIDAHADLRDVYSGSPYNHACVMRRIAEDDPEASMVAVGVRAVSREEVDFARERGVHLFPAHTLGDPAEWIDPVIEALGEEVYLSVDLDGFDPAVLPTTGTPVPGGLGWRPVLQLLGELCRRRRLVGADVVELRPDGVNHHGEFLAAQLVYKIIGNATAPRR